MNVSRPLQTHRPRRLRRVFHVTDHFKADIGAAWKKTSQNSGGEYLSAEIDDISFPAKAYCRLVKTGTDKGHTLFWDRDRKRS